MTAFDVGPKGEVEEEQFRSLLEEHFKRIAADLRKTVSNIMGDAEAEYLPYLCSDTVANLRGQMIQAVTYDDNKESLRRVIFEEHREELVNDRIEELENEVRLLRSLREQSGRW